MVVGVKALVAAQGTMAYLVTDLAQDLATAIAITAMAATTTAMRSTVTTTAHRVTITTTAMEHSIDTHLQLLLVLLLRLHACLISKKLREDIIDRMQLYLGHERLNEWIKLMVKNCKNEKPSGQYLGLICDE
jgi:hypothetical protein